jgi:hypothetical protein
MMLPERWLVAVVLGLTLSLASMAGSVFGQQENAAKSASQAKTSTSGQQAVPAKAVPDPNAPPPPDDPQAQPPKKDDDLAPEPDPGEGEGARGVPAQQPQESQNSGSSQNQDASRAQPPTTEKVATEVSPANNSPATNEGQVAPTPQVVESARTPKTQPPERHGKYDDETVHLLSLIQQLKSEVDKAGANTLSLAALRKADEIQRVAKELKEKMREQGATVASRP